MSDDTYVLDLWVTGADAVSVIDDGTGIDTIRVAGVYAAPILIDLARTVSDGAPTSAGSLYYSDDSKGRSLTILGTIENACGSNGSDSIIGNALANLLFGDRKATGAGLSDTLQGGGGDDSLYGGAGADLIWGGAEDDAIWGDAGADVIDGGSGRDTVAGGSGADALNGGGDLGDMLSYAASRRGVVVALQDGTVTLGRGGDAKGDQITGFTDIIGSRAADRITMVYKIATAPANQVYGGGGNDQIATGGGNDLAYGGTEDDMLLGEMGNDSLWGDAGTDRLTGGYGQDMLTGGSQADQFIFNAAPDSTVQAPDLITDFNGADLDTIVLTGVDADVTQSGNQAFRLIDGGFTGQVGELRAVAQGSDLAVQGDTDGDGLADLIIILQDVATVTVGDLVL